MNSQYNEEEIILKFFGNFKGKFLDIGAFDGITGSNTRTLAESGWSGTLIEPNPEVFIKLLKNCSEFPRLKCVNAAVTGTRNSGLRKFFGEGQRGTLVDKTESHFWVSAIDPFDIKVIFGDVDFLSVDAEGLDFEILESALGAYEPKLICFEDDLPDTRNPEYKSSMLSLLSDFGYRKIVGTTSTARHSANTLVSR